MTVAALHNMLRGQALSAESRDLYDICRRWYADGLAEIVRVSNNFPGLYQAQHTPLRSETVLFTHAVNTDATKGETVLAARTAFHFITFLISASFST